MFSSHGAGMILFFRRPAVVIPAATSRAPETECCPAVLPICTDLSALELTGPNRFPELLNRCRSWSFKIGSLFTWPQQYSGHDHPTRRPPSAYMLLWARHYTSEAWPITSKLNPLTQLVLSNNTIALLLTYNVEVRNRCITSLMDIPNFLTGNTSLTGHCMRRWID